MGSIYFVNEKLYLFPWYKMRLLVKKGHAGFKYFKYVSSENMKTLWADLASTLHYSVDIAESLNEKRKQEQKETRKCISPFL